MTTTTVTKPMTAEEYLLTPDNGKPTELIKGVIVEMSLSTPRHGEICVNSSYLLRRFLDDNPLGRVVSNDAGVITERGPDTVRGPDIAYYSYTRVPRGPLPLGYIDVAPDLAIDVRSPSDRWPAIRNKVNELLNAGVTLVCVLDEQSGMAHVFPADRPPYPVAADGELDLSEVLPGCRIPVRKFFE